MRKTRTFLTAAAAVSAALLLAACGGNGGDDAPAEDPNVVPRSATSSIAAWFRFAGALASSESSEALLLTNVEAGALPTSDSEEPMSLGQ